MKARLKYCLFNESGGPNLEELIGIAYSLAVGAALFGVGRNMRSWLNNAGSAIGQLSSAVPS